MSAPDPQRAIDPPSPRQGPPAALNSERSIVPAHANSLPAVRLSSQQPSVDPTPIQGSAAAHNDRHAISSAESNSHPRDGASSDPAKSSPKATSPTSDRLNVPEQQGHTACADQAAAALLLWDPVLQTLADGLDDIESTRIAQANRYRILTTTKPDDDGEVRGFGLAENHPAVVALDAQLKTLEFLDASMTKALRKQLRAHPLFPLVSRTKGLGDKTVARLLAAVRDPYWNDLHNRPRTIGELFAFCGVAGPGQRRQRGIKSNWSPDARKRLWIMTGPIIRGDGPYRAVYDAGRERYANKTHTVPCAQCGKKGQPAEIGSEWRDGHKHAGAIRLVMREILRDLWTEARDVYDRASTASTA